MFDTREGAHRHKRGQGDPSGSSTATTPDDGYRSHAPPSAAPRPEYELKAPRSSERGRSLSRAITDRLSSLMMSTDFETAFAAHRPALLRHCYRMLGSFAEAEDLTQDTLERAWKARADYRGDAHVRRWLYAIATNACLNALARRRALPQLEAAPAGDDYVLDVAPPERWLTPAADARLFPDPAELTEARETVALAFVALLQRVPPKPRATLLLRDVLGWSAEETAAALELTVSSVNSAVLRAREAIARATPDSEEPPPEALRAFVHAWQSRDLDALIALLRRDVTLAMPPYAVWFSGVEPVIRFFQTSRFGQFWSNLARVELTRANAQPAFIFYSAGPSGLAPHSIMVTRFVAGQVAEMTTFIGTNNFAGFDLSPQIGA